MLIALWLFGSRLAVLASRCKSAVGAPSPLPSISLSRCWTCSNQLVAADVSVVRSRPWVQLLHCVWFPKICVRRSWVRRPAAPCVVSCVEDTPTVGCLFNKSCAWLASYRRVTLQASMCDPVANAIQNPRPSTCPPQNLTRGGPRRGHDRKSVTGDVAKFGQLGGSEAEGCLIHRSRVPGGEGEAAREAVWLRSLLADNERRILVPVNLLRRRPC